MVDKWASLTCEERGIVRILVRRRMRGVCAAIDWALRTRR